jgi:RND family efflux transporter MFP subunit
VGGTPAARPAGAAEQTVKRFLSRQPLWLKALAVLALAAGAWFVFKPAKSESGGVTFAARRGPLEIAVLEGGSVEALESQDVKCEVRGYQGVKILKLVEEGYQVIEDDVRTNRVLVELDSSEIRKQITQKDIDLETSVANLIEARQSYAIQLHQNLSDIKAAEQKARFARMDLEKYLGDQATEQVLQELELFDEDSPALTNRLERAATVASTQPPTNATASTNGSPPSPSAPAEGGQVTELKLVSGGDQLPQVEVRSSGAPTRSDEAPSTPEPEPPKVDKPKKTSIDFSRFAKLELLGDGEAKQKLRKFEDDLQVAQREMGIAKTTLEGTRRLFGRGFITKTELENDEIKFENSRLKVQTAETARALFIKYEFPKAAEEFVSKYAEGLRELGRARKSAVSKLAQAEAKVKASEGKHNLESKQRKDLGEQLEKCYIRAKRTGLVVYGGGNMNVVYYGQEQIREGAMVREQQPIITIPDTSRMCAKVRIHESYIKKVEKGQRARITVDAFPDKQLEGEVTKVAVLPDSQNRWMNPDLKVYLTTIVITGVHEWLKPGMSAKVEILVKQLPDVVYVPIQAVTPFEGKQVCFVANGDAQERREVEIGESNEEFIEIKRGIKEGEKVSLRSRSSSPKDAGAQAPTNNSPQKPKQAAAPLQVGGGA